MTAPSRAAETALAGSPPKRPRRRGAKRSSAPYSARKKLMLGIGGTLFFLLIAEVVTRTGLIVDQKYLPPVSSTLMEAARLIIDPSFLGDVAATMSAWVVAVAMAMVIGVPLGILLATSKASYALSSSVIAAIRPIPAVALIPLALLVWGNGMPIKVGLALFGIIWPILFNTMYGVHDIDPIARDSARSYGIRRGRFLRRVVLPSTAPFILTGLRIAASLAFIIIVSTELFAGTRDGIGSFILLTSSSGGETKTVIAGALWAGVIGVLINIVLVQIDDRAFRWAHRGENA